MSLSQTLQNELGSEKSAYLSSAASQPVNWQPWGEAALEKAKQLDRPILLDIGAVWCHWCHVMDRESYENTRVAEIINEHFIAIKVDRDERPDVDIRYQRAVSAISGQGGWPLTAFLTPEGKVFYGGTYFPPEDAHGRPGFTTLLKRIAHLYKTQRGDITRDAEQLFEYLASTPRTAVSSLEPALMDSMLQSCRTHFDPAYGGFGDAPKFLHPETINLLFLAHDSGKGWALPMALKTLEAVARGGVYDQLGGGFHRYSTDARWVVPHFEKMLYDNAGLLTSYCTAYGASGQDVFYRDVAHDIIRYLREWMSDDARGGFYASQDADISLEDDGDYFTWTREEVEGVVTKDEARIIVPYYDIYESGEMRHDPSRNVLHVSKPLDEIARAENVPLEKARALLASGKEKLIRKRTERSTPFIDKTLYVNWNAMMITAFLEAYRTFGDAPSRDFALKTLDRMVRSSWQDGEGFRHVFSDEASDVKGLFDDQIQAAAALVAAFEVTGDWRYFEKTEQVLRLCVEHYWDTEGGGFFDRDPRFGTTGSLMQSPQKPIMDSPTPSSNGVAAQVFQKMYLITGEKFYHQYALDILKTFAKEAEAGGLFASTYGIALHMFFTPPVHVVVIGQKDSEATKALVRAAYAAYRPGKILTRVDPDEMSGRSLPEIVRAQAASVDLSHPTAFVCASTSCAPPTQDVQELKRLVQDFNK